MSSADSPYTERLGRWQKLGAEHVVGFTHTALVPSIEKRCHSTAFHFRRVLAESLIVTFLGSMGEYREGDWSLATSSHRTHV